MDGARKRGRGKSVAALEGLDRFDLSPAEARIQQRRIRPLVERRNRLGPVRIVAGADISLKDKLGFAGVILYQFPELIAVERAWASGPLRFPYVPGLLSFREIPLLLKAFQKLKRRPDLILADAHGWAHPRRAGLACHLGLLLDIPTIGCAKSILVGTHETLGEKRGSVAGLMNGPIGKKEKIGVVLRTRDGVKPVYVSCGHRVGLATAVRYAQGCVDGYRIPKPQREADRWVGQLRRKWAAGTRSEGASGGAGSGVLV